MIFLFFLLIGWFRMDLVERGVLQNELDDMEISRERPILFFCDLPPADFWEFCLAKVLLVWA